LERFRACFAELRDPREANRRFSLHDLLFMALSAVLCGAQSCTEMAEFARWKRYLLSRFVDLRHGTPSHDTFSRLFNLLDPERFETALGAFAAQFAGHVRGVVALDGKSVRRAFGKEGSKKPLHLVSAFAVDARLVLAQRKAPGRNEHAAMHDVLELLALKGCTVTADAYFCYPAIARAIQERGGDYVIALKRNHGPLWNVARACFAVPAPLPACASVDTRHGRRERRTARVIAIPGLDKKHRFPGLAALGQIRSTRTIHGRTTTETRYFVLSRQLSPTRLLKTARAHWAIENSLHWVLDVVLDEDRARNRTDHGPQNLAVLRRLVLNILRLDTSKGSLRSKIKRAGWDDDFFLSIWSHMR